jgi:peptidoglycan/xylan/chitin deacetylase (PgdA/CDA1 family)
MGLRSTALRAVSGTLYHSGLLGPVTRAVTYTKSRPRLPILTFHRVNDDHDPFLPSLPTAVFAGRMAHIARHYEVLPVEELALRLRQGRAPRNALALTFDDGYRDNLTHVAPILKRLGLPATIFLVTGYIGTPNALWFDRVAMAFKIATVRRVVVGHGRMLPLGTVRERLLALDAALAHLKQMPDEDRLPAVEHLISALHPGGPERPKRLMLSWDEVGALRGLGFSIGAHTVTHPILSRLAPARAWEEIQGSKAAIEKTLGEPVSAFAYPNGGVGDYNDTVKELVRAAGFSCAVTTRRGLNDTDTPVLELRRGGPWEHHLPTYALKLAYYSATGA